MNKEVVGHNLLAILQSLFSGVHEPFESVSEDLTVKHICEHMYKLRRALNGTWIPILLNMNPVKLKYMTNILIICPFALK